MKKILLTVFLSMLLGTIPAAVLAEDAPDTADIEKKQDSILRVLGRLERQKGILITGRAIVDDTFTSGNGKAVSTNSGTQQNDPFIQVDLDIEGRPAPTLTVGGIIRLQNIFGGFYGSSGDLIAAREIYLKADILDFIHIDAGDFRENLTPFTVWAPVRFWNHDAAVFQNDVEDALYERYLTDQDKWPLQGVKLTTGFTFNFFFTDLDLKAFGARLATTPFDRILSGGVLQISRNDGLLKLTGTVAGFNDLAETKKSAGLPLENYVLSARVESSPFKFVNLSFELDQSHFDFYTNVAVNAKPHSSYTDTAYSAGIEFRLFNTTLGGKFISVGNEYYAPAAQTPVVDLSGNSGNLPLQGLARGFHELNYVNTISPNRKYDSPLSYSFPMNEATPNRQGFMIDLASHTISFLEINGSWSLLNSIRPVACKENRVYTSYAVSGRLDLSVLLRNSLFPAITGSYFSDNQTRSDDSATPLVDESEDSTLSFVGCGLEWRPVRNWALLAGYDFLTEKGHRFLNAISDSDPLSPNIVNLPSAQDRLESILDLAAAFTPGKGVSLRLDFFLQTFADNLAAARNYDVSSLRIYSKFLF